VSLLHLLYLLEHQLLIICEQVVFTTLSPVLLVSDTVRMVIKAVHPNITVAVQEDPGLPIGMTSALNADRSELSVAWTPRAGQEGAMHELFVVATRNGVKSKDFAVRIGVAAGALAWDKPTQLETTHQIMVGQTKSAELVCVSNYPTDIKVYVCVRAACVYLRVRVCACVCGCVFACVCVCMCVVCIYICPYINTHTYATHTQHTHTQVAPNTTMPEHMSLTMTRAPRTLLGSGELAPFAPVIKFSKSSYSL
jgi:hypothetical protein